LYLGKEDGLFSKPINRFQIRSRNQSPVTSSAPCGNSIFIGYKNGYLEKWDIAGKARLQTVAKSMCSSAAPSNYKGHIGSILAVEVSPDGKYVVTAGTDKRIIVRSTSDLSVLKIFHNHRKAVTSLSFQKGKNFMYSASVDRTIKVWSLDSFSYVESLFGHEDEILDVAGFSRERCVSVGARDRSARVWKVVDETQLVFKISEKSNKSNEKSSPAGSIDCVAVIDEQHFVTGGDNG